MLSRLNKLDLCGLVLKLNNSLGQVVIQSKKVRTSLTRLGVRAFQNCQAHLFRAPILIRGDLLSTGATLSSFHLLVELGLLLQLFAAYIW